MSTKGIPFTYRDITHAQKLLKKFKLPTVYNSKGEPCYHFLFHGTRKEFETVKRELKGTKAEIK